MRQLISQNAKVFATITLAFAALSSVIFPLVKTHAVNPLFQGKGGEVVVKPTPTKAPNTKKSASREITNIPNLGFGVSVYSNSLPIPGKSENCEYIGITVERVDRSGPARIGGLRKGDLIAAVNGKRFDQCNQHLGMSDLLTAVKNTNDGTVEIEVSRFVKDDSQKLTIWLKQ